MGTVVTINASNLSSIPSENEVFFGTIRATITSTTATTLVTSVPPGATYDHIIVKTDGRGISYSPRPFIVTFNSNGEIGSSSFAAKIDFPGISNNKANELAVGDLDGDGWTDVATANQDGTVSIFKNIATSSDPFTSSSLTATVNLVVAPVTPYSGNIEAISIEDLDMDGYPDILVAVPTNSLIVIFKNLGGPISASSFQAKVELSVPSCFDIAVSDMDLDGKVDLILPNHYYSTVSVLRNVSTPGTINSSSFSGAVTFETGGKPVSVAVGDLDGDNRPDIATASNENGHWVSVLRNSTTGAGNFTSSSFEAHKDFNCVFAPVQLYLTDLDRDGRKDIVTSQMTNLNTFRNASTPGEISLTSFVNRLQFQSDYNTVHAAIGDFDGDSFPDVVTANNYTGKVSVFENSNVPGTVADTANTMLNPKVDFTTGASPSGTGVADFNNDGKPDIVTASNVTGNISVVLNTNTRITSPPLITSISPGDGTFNDVVLVTGSNFSVNPNSNLVKIGSVRAFVKSATPTMLTIVVPLMSTTGLLSVRVNGFETATSSSQFTVHQIPSVTNISPLQGPIGSDVIIEGLNFSASPTENIVYFGATRAVVTQASETSLTVKVPAGATYKPISVTVHNLTATSSKPFIVTFQGSALNAESFKSKVSFDSYLQYPQQLKVGDLNGDGKAEIIVSNLYDVVVVHNTKGYGDIDASFFKPWGRVNLGPVLSYNQMHFVNHIDLADLDSDGRLDLLVAYDNKVAWIRNISTLNTIAFAPPVAIPSANGLTISKFTVADFDKDGKLDIVFGTGAQIGVIKNSSIRGTFSMAPAKMLYVNNNFGLGRPLLCDMDGDRKEEIVYFNADGYYPVVSIHQNTSAPFATHGPTVLPAVNFPRSYQASSLVFSDLDLDGKSDVITVNENAEQTLSIFRNQSSSTGITATLLASRFDFALGNFSSDLVVADLDGDGKPDIITTGSSNFNYYPTVFKNISQPGTLDANSFQARRNYFIGGMDYRPVDAADLNGDGSPELIAVADYYLLISQNYNAIPPPRQSQTIEFGELPMKQYGEDLYVALPKYASSGLPITYSSSAPTVANVYGEWIRIENAGSTNITATQNGNEVYAPAQPVVRVLTVAKAKQSIVFDELPVKHKNDTPFYLLARSSAPYGYYLPIEYSSSNLQVATIKDTVVTIGGSGVTMIKASQRGDQNYEPAADAFRELVVRADGQVITFSPLSSVKATATAFTLSATSTSGLPIEYVSSDLNVATISGDQVTIKGKGQTLITAKQNGNVAFPPAQPVTRELVVEGVSQTIDFPEFSVLSLTDPPFLILATSTANLPLSFSSSNPAVAKVSGQQLSILATGQADITAKQEGNAFYFPAEPVTRKLTVSSITALENEVNDEIAVMPNPASSSLTITTSGAPGETIISIFDGRGVLLLRKYDVRSTETTLDIADLLPGLYFLEIRQRNTTTHRKFVKK